MPKMPEFDPIEYLLSKRLPASIAKRPASGTSITLQELNAKKDTTRQAIIAELRSKTAEELNALVAEEFKKEAEADELRRKREEAARWFNLPAVTADYEHWSRAAYWTLDEGIALSFGREPSRVNWEAIKSHRQVSTFAAAYDRRLDLARRAAAMGQLANSNLPGFFLGWAKRNGFDVPTTLLELVERNGQEIADWPTLLKRANQQTREALDQGNRHRKEALELGERLRNEVLAAWQSDARTLKQRIQELESKNEVLRSEQPTSQNTPPDGVGERERTSLFKIVIGMAIKGYGHDPRASRTKTAREIADDLMEMGIPLDEDTVRKYLQQAAELLPKPETEQKGR